MHGSGYGQFKKHLTEKFEKNISDEFIFGFLLIKVNLLVDTR